MKYLARNYYECEKGRRWSECVTTSHITGKSCTGEKIDRTVKSQNTQDGDFCAFSGCLENDHKVKLIKSVPWEEDEKSDEKYNWFRGYNPMDIEKIKKAIKKYKTVYEKSKKKKSDKSDKPVTIIDKNYEELKILINTAELYLLFYAMKSYIFGEQATAESHIKTETPDKPISVKITEWQHEDEMTEDSMYDALFPLSKVDIVRLFPKKITTNP